MIETGVVEIDIDSVEILIDSTSNTERSSHLKNPFAQSKSDISNKRSIDHSYNKNDNEQNTKKIRHELGFEEVIIESNNEEVIIESNNEEVIIESNNGLDYDVIEVEDVVRKESGGEGEKIDKTVPSKLQHNDNNPQEQICQNTPNVSDDTNNILEDNNRPTEENPPQENNHVNKNKEECEVVWEGIGDKSVENYIRGEVEKRVKERVEAFENIAKAQILEHELIWMNKYRKVETELALELEKQKNEEEAMIVKNETQEENKDELVQAILLEKKLEEKEAILKSRIERLKAIESKILQQILEIKLIRKQNRELLKMKIKEWEDEEKYSQDGQQEISIKDDGVLINDESIDCECIDDIEINKSKSSTEEIRYAPKLNEFQKLPDTQLTASRAEREKCRPTRMSHGEWEHEIKERIKRKRNLKFKGINPKPWTGPRDIEAFFKKEMGLIIKVDHILKLGRDVVVQFKNMIDKITIIKRIKFSNCGISVTNDLTPREEEVQKWLRDEADWLRLKGYSVKTDPMKLMINGVNWVWNEELGDLIPQTI